MRGKALLAAALTAAITVVIGCHHDKHKISFNPKEEAVLPPNEDRFNKPPAAEYRQRPQKNDDKALLGGQNKMGPGGPGQGNPGGF
ncbi:MAG: hypothetical protein JWO38_4100 [Gemmataceae bacterium]|nr:hypothetical protein [Gemmataceae bacterium]